MQNPAGLPPITSNRFDTKIHTEQIAAYLPLLNNKAISLINSSQERTDSLIPIYGSQFDNAYHFDNNRLWGATARINEGYRAAIDAFDSKPDDIFKYFGRITHALQDFYSHSNWYELSRAGFTGDQRLLDEGFGFFEELKPFKKIGETRIVSLERDWDVPIERWGRDKITDWGLVRNWYVDTSTYVVTATTNRNEVIGGLMSGEVNGKLYGLGNSVKIIDRVTGKVYSGFDHGGLAGTILPFYLGPLAKDKNTDRYHTEVLELARDQIQHELVRLIGLIHENYGQDGLRKFSSFYVRDGFQDEFKALISSREFASKQLAEKEKLNILQDNEGTDQVLNSFFSDESPEVTVIPGDHLLPHEIERFDDEIEDGKFRWVASPDATDDPNIFSLQVKRNSGWFTTSFTSDEFLDYR